MPRSRSSSPGARQNACKPSQRARDQPAAGAASCKETISSASSGAASGERASGMRAPSSPSARPGGEGQDPSFTRRTSQQDQEYVLTRINMVLHRWASYFRHAIAQRVFHMDNFMWRGQSACCANGTTEDGRTSAAGSLRPPGNGCRSQRARSSSSGSPRSRSSLSLPRQHELAGPPAPERERLLAEWFARGEIDEDEYLLCLTSLRGAGPAAAC